MARMIAMISVMAIFSVAPLAMAATKTCEVVSVTEKEVVLKCKDVQDLVVGDQVKIKTQKKRKAVEGC